MKKRILNLLLVAAMLLTVVFSAVGCADKRTPVETLTDAAGKTSEQISGFFHSEILQSAAKNGSVSISSKAEGMGDLNLTAYLNEDPSKQYVRADMNASALGFGVRCDMTQSSIAVSSEKLLGNKAYGLDLSSVKEKFAASALADPSSSMYIGEENVNMLKEMLNQLTSSSAEGLDLNAVYARYRNLLLKQLEESGKLEKTSEKGQITVSAQLTHEDLTKIYKAFVTEIKADQQLKSFILSIQSIPGVDELPDDFYEGLDNSVKEFEDSEDKPALAFTVVINKKGGTVKNAEIRFLEKEKEVGKLTFANETSKITVDFTSDELTAHFQMNLEAKAVKSMEGKITAIETDEDDDAAAPEDGGRTEIEFKWEATDASKSEYSYTAKSFWANNLLLTSTVKGTVTVNGKESIVITADISAAEEGTDDEDGSVSSGIGLLGSFSSLTITIKANDPAPEFPAYDNLLDMSDNALAALIADIGEKIGIPGRGEIDDSDFDFDFDDSDFDFDFDDSDLDF